MEFNKINNLLGPAHDKVPIFFKKWIEVQSQSGNTYNMRRLQCLELIYAIILMLMCG